MFSYRNFILYMFSMFTSSYGIMHCVFTIDVDGQLVTFGDSSMHYFIVFDKGFYKYNTFKTEGAILWNKSTQIVILSMILTVFSLGVWSPYIGAMAGVKVPLITLRHAYVVTETIEGVRNMPNVRDHDGSLYLKLQGDTLCVGGYEPNPIFWDNVREIFFLNLIFFFYNL